MGLNSHCENARQGSGSRTLRNPKVLARVSNGQREALRNWEVTVSGHKYKTGQLVDYLGRERASGVYQITQLLPPQGEAFQYWIKNVNEHHERVAKENELRSA
jgi:hypothetical protein